MEKSSAKIFLRDEPEVSRVADDDELASAFDEMKAALPYGLDEYLASDFAFDILDGSPDNPASRGRPGLKDLSHPVEIGRTGTPDAVMIHLHAQIVRQHG
jgi:hypothetical protein